MTWLEDAKQIYKEEPLSERKKRNIHPKTVAELLVNLDEVESIHFSESFPEKELVSLLPQILDSAPNLRKFSIFYPLAIDWETLASVHLDKIEELIVWCKGNSFTQPLQAPNLKSLCLYEGREKLMPLELISSEPTHFNFSGSPLLENLEIKDFQLIDPAGFQDLALLKRLVIMDSCLEDLDWLKDTAYQLEKLTISNSLTNCDGLAYQPHLKELVFLYANIKDSSPIENLKELTRLELYDCLVADETNLQKMDIENKIISRREREFASIRRNVQQLTRYAVDRIRSEDEKVKKHEELSPLRRKFLLRDVNEPFEVRASKHIKRLYNDALKRMDEPGYLLRKYISPEEYRNYYINYAQEYYPFLRKKDNHD